MAGELAHSQCDHFVDYKLFLIEEKCQPWFCYAKIELVYTTREEDRTNYVVKILVKKIWMETIMLSYNHRQEQDPGGPNATILIIKNML